MTADFSAGTWRANASALGDNRRMPEMPEVEVTRQALELTLAGQTLRAVALGRPLRWPLGCPPELLSGRRVATIGRRGKYLLLQVDGGELLIHLGMSGSLRWAGADPPGPHDHVLFDTERGQLRLRDPRRFGAVIWHPQGTGVHPLIAHLGPEPLGAGFDGAVLHAALAGRGTAIKLALLDQRVVAGVGNIYACESLFRAGIDPRAAAGSLSRPRAERLAAAIRDTLAEAVAAGGSTLRDFHHADGGAGGFQERALVYGRAGLPCARCGSPLLHLVQGQRRTDYCRRCQRR